MSGLHLPAGAANTQKPWVPVESDLVRTRNCPYATTVLTIPQGIGPGGMQMAIAPQWAPCNRKCVYFRPDAQNTAEKASGICGKAEDLQTTAAALKRMTSDGAEALDRMVAAMGKIGDTGAQED